MRTRGNASRTPTNLAVTCLVALTGLVGLSACSGGSDSSSGSSDQGITNNQVVGGAAGTAQKDPPDVAEGAPTIGSGADFSSGSNSDAFRSGSTPDAGATHQVLLESSALIKTGSVALQSDDIGHVLTQVYGIVGGIGGDISKEDTSTDAKGKAVRSTMVLRVPVEDFDTTLLQLSKLGTLVNRVSNAKDVTTEVADIDSRVRSAQRSINTLRQLFDRANKLTDIIRLESELSQRESDLESLEAQQRSLDDRTTMSTITLTMELPPVAPKPKPVPHHDDTAGGFVSGIHQGWDALTTTVRAVGHGLGVVLPLGTMALLVAGLVYWLVRRFTPQTPTGHPDEPAQA